MRINEKEYLGEAVTCGFGINIYAEVDEFGAITLTTSNGIRVTNTIVLEPEVIAALFEMMGWKVPA